MTNERDWRKSDWDMPPLYAELYARNQELERQLQEAREHIELQARVVTDQLEQHARENGRHERARALLEEAGQDAADGSLLARAASIIACPTCYSADEIEQWQLDRMAYQTKLRAFLADKEPVG